MLGHNHLATSGTPAIPEHFIPGLFRKCFPLAVQIIAKELTRLECHGDRDAKYGEVGDGAHIFAMDTMAYAPAIRAFAIRKTASSEYMVLMVVTKLRMFYQKITW